MRRGQLRNIHFPSLQRMPHRVGYGPSSIIDGPSPQIHAGLVMDPSSSSPGRLMITQSSSSTSHTGLAITACDVFSLFCHVFKLLCTRATTNSRRANAACLLSEYFSLGEEGGKRQESATPALPSSSHL